MNTSLTFRRVGLNVVGVALTEDGRRVTAPVGQYVVATVHARPYDAATTWGTAVLKVRASNFDEGGFADLPTAVTIAGPGGITDQINIAGYKYIAVEVFTAEGAAEFADIAIILSDKKV